MQPDELKRYLRGVLAFPITPFKDDLSVDYDALQRNIEFMLARGIRAIAVCGGTGELYSLSQDEITACYRAAVEVARGRAAVVAGVGFNGRIGAALAEAAEKAGADGILVLPAYYGRAEDEGFVAYYCQIAQATGLGVLPYARDAALLSPNVVARLAEVPNIVAFKDGQGDIRLFTRIRNHVESLAPGRLVWMAGVGDDAVDAYFAAGAEGFTSSIANFMPAVALELYEAASSGDFARVRRLIAERVLAFYNLRIRRRGYEVAVVKAAMDLAGLRGGPVRPPLVDLSADERELLRGLMERAGALAAAR
jgi:5-dehydro-4-deoxyglucarate dehydratase